MTRGKRIGRWTVVASSVLLAGAFIAWQAGGSSWLRGVGAGTADDPLLPGSKSYPFPAYQQTPPASNDSEATLLPGSKSSLFTKVPRIEPDRAPPPPSQRIAVPDFDDPASTKPK